MLGMKWPRLSSTATSSWTVLTSLLKVGKPSGTSLSFLENLEGIFGWSVASAGASFFFGLATVSDCCDPGPWAAANRNETPASINIAPKMTKAFKYFITPLEETIAKPVTFRRRIAFQPVQLLY